MKTLEGYAENMRYEIRLQGTMTVVATTEALDVAKLVHTGTSFPTIIWDNWTGSALPERSDRLPTTDLPLDALRTLLMDGRKIPAIKLVRELSGLSLGEAKAYVDRLDAQEQLRARAVDGL